MFISEIFASGFRCFGVDNALTLKLRRGLNILVGPNDAGRILRRKVASGQWPRIPSAESGVLRVNVIGSGLRGVVRSENFIAHAKLYSTGLVRLRSNPERADS
jgi:hypothetical protein